MLARVVFNVIKNGPQWVPAEYNGKKNQGYQDTAGDKSKSEKRERLVVGIVK